MDLVESVGLEGLGGCGQREALSPESLLCVQKVLGSLQHPQGQGQADGSLPESRKSCCLQWGQS